MEPLAKLDPTTEMALRSLHDIAMPEPVSWMPQTWGWAVLVGTIVLLLLLAALRAVRRFRRNAYRREALRRLAALGDGLAVGGSRESALRQLPEVLKRTALAAWPRAQVAGLCGTNWTQFLMRSGDAGRELAPLLDDLEYRGDAALGSLSEERTRNVLRAARQWIEGHDVSA